IDEIRSAAQLAPAVRPFVSPHQTEAEIVTHYTRETSATLSPLAESGIQRLMVSYTGQRPEAFKVLNSLVENYATQLRSRRKEQHEREHQQAVAKVAAAAAQVTAAQQRLV